MSLTPRQRQVLDVIRDLIRAKGYSPTYQEIGDAMGGLSKTSVFEHVNALVEKGFVERGDPHQARNIKIVGAHKVVLEEAVAVVVDIMERHRGVNPEVVASLVTTALNSLKRY